MTREAQALGLGVLGVLSSGIAMTTGHPVAVAVAAASAGALVGVLRDGASESKVGDLGGTRAAFFAEAIEKGGQGYYTFKSSPLLADANEQGIKKAAEGKSLYVYRIPGQGMEPTSFVVANSPRSYTGARQVYGGSSAPKVYDASRPPSIDNIIRIPVIVKRVGDNSPPTARIQATTPPRAPQTSQASFKGAGGWSYFRAQDGSFLIVNDPRPGRPMQGKTVARGSKAWAAIDSEMRSAGR